jgi:hypothetical protein
MFQRVRERNEKAYVRLTTSEGPLNFELYADRVSV